LVRGEKAKQSAPKAKVSVRQNRNDDLPSECHEDDIWSTKVVSSMLMWASCHYSPWSIDDKETAYALSMICPVFYSPKIIAEMSLDDPGCPAVRIVYRSSSFTALRSLTQGFR